MTNTNIQNVLTQLNQLSKRVEFSRDIPGTKVTETKSDFSEELSKAFKMINQQQLKAAEIATEYQLDNKDIDITKVMLEIQKARVSFEALNQVRNQFVNAYQNIMNMQI